MIWEDKGRWHVKHDGNYAIVASKVEAESRLAKWKGSNKIVGAIVEESILDADLDGDGIIEKAELEEWLEKDE